MELRQIPDSRRIDVWRFALDVGPVRQAAASHLLSPDENSRAGRFHYDIDRSRYVMARATVRALLGSYLGLDPAGLAFAYGPFGKPFLQQPPGSEPVHFNLSHSDDLALLAVTRSAPVGIDLEAARPDFPVDEIISEFFAPVEASALSALLPPERTASFFRYWTRKEAYFKALGCGMTDEVKVVDVSDPPECTSIWFMVRRNGILESERSLCDLDGSAGFAAALAVDGPPSSVTVHLDLL